MMETTERVLPVTAASPKSCHELLVYKGGLVVVEGVNLLEMAGLDASAGYHVVPGSGILKAREERLVPVVESEGDESERITA